MSHDSHGRTRGRPSLIILVRDGEDVREGRAPERSARPVMGANRDGYGSLSASRCATASTRSASTCRRYWPSWAWSRSTGDPEAAVVTLARRLLTGAHTARELAALVHRTFGHQLPRAEGLATLDDESDICASTAAEPSPISQGHRPGLPDPPHRGRALRVEQVWLSQCLETQCADFFIEEISIAGCRRLKLSDCYQCTALSGKYKKGTRTVGWTPTTIRRKA